MALAIPKELMLYIIKEIEKTEIVKQQEADTTVDVFTGIPFDNDKRHTNYNG